MSQPTQTSKKRQMTKVETFDKEALLNYFSGDEARVAKVLLSNDVQYTITEAERLISQWKETIIQ